MKKAKILVFALAAVFTLNACKPTPEEARKYNDRLIEIEKKLSEKETAFINSISEDKTADEINKAYNELSKQAEEAVASAEKMEVFDNSTAFLDAAKNYFKSIKEITNNEYKEMVQLVTKKKEEVTDADSEKYSKLVEQIQAKSEKVLSAIQTEQLIFATKYNFKVEDSSKEEKK